MQVFLLGKISFNIGSFTRLCKTWPLYGDKRYDLLQLGKLHNHQLLWGKEMIKLRAIKPEEFYRSISMFKWCSCWGKRGYNLLATHKISHGNTWFKQSRFRWAKMWFDWCCYRGIDHSLLAIIGALLGIDTIQLLTTIAWRILRIWVSFLDW